MAFDKVKTTITGKAMKFSTSKTPNGKDITKFTVASQPGDKDKDGKYITRWFNVAVWGEYGHKLVETIGEKGWVTLEGKLKAPRTWTDKNTGEVRISEEIECDSRDVYGPPRAKAEATVVAAPTFDFTDSLPDSI